MLKAVQKEYARHSKSTRFYDYYEADSLFDELTRTIAEPLNKTAVTLPEQTERLNAEIMLRFERLTEHADTSSCSWMTCYSTLTDAWFSALVAQKDTYLAVTARKIVTFLSDELFFGNCILKNYRTLLGNDILPAVRDYYYQQQHYCEATDISLLLRDGDFLARAVNNDEFSDPQHYFGYARLLIDEVHPGKALALLELMVAQR